MVHTDFLAGSQAGAQSGLVGESRKATSFTYRLGSRVAGLRSSGPDRSSTNSTPSLSSNLVSDLIAQRSLTLRIQDFLFGDSCSTAVRGGSLLGLLLAFTIGVTLALPAAQAGDPGGLGTEGQGSLPSYESGVGLAIVGDLADVLAVIGETAGDGEVQLVALDANTSAALITGDLRISIDREALAAGGVSVHLVLGDELAGGVAEARYGTWDSGLFFLPQFSLELPLADIYGPQAVESNHLRLRALGLTGALLDLQIGLHDGILTVAQSIRE